VLQQLNIENSVFKTDLYFFMIDTSAKHSIFRITKNLYETMVRFQIPIDDRIKIVFYQAFKNFLKEKGDEAKNKASNKNGGKNGRNGFAHEQISDKEYLINRKEQQILITNSKLCKRVGYQYKFVKRTFKTKANRDRVKVEEVKMKLSEKCGKCQG
jgi:hypothetical protein